MTRISRRRFLNGLGIGAGALAAGGYSMTVWRHGSPTAGTPGASPPAPATSVATAPTTSPTMAAPAAAAGRTLVVVELGGGNDSLNTVVPYADPAYRTLRPSLGVGDPIVLDDSIGLAPQLEEVASLYRRGQVAIVEGLGFPDPDLSHFASLARWWTATTDGGDGTGWIGRYLDRAVGEANPLAGITIGSSLSPAMVGRASSAISIVDQGGLQPRPPRWVGEPDAYVEAWARLSPRSPDPSTATGRLQASIGDALTARQRLAADLAGFDGETPGELTDDPPASSATVASMRLAAQLIASADPPQVIVVSGNGDYDTHEGLAERHPPLLAALDAGIGALFNTLERAGAGERAVVMTTSEFGRRAAENGTGTDHGTAAAHFVIGPAVRGGRYGAPPSLGALDDHGNLVATTDPRRLYAAVLGTWLTSDPVPIVGSAFDPLPLF